MIGEVGFFLGGRRVANVDVVEDARLLRLTPEDLERLRRRRPRIAATLLRNLNVFTAERLVRSTDREKRR